MCFLMDKPAKEAVRELMMRDRRAEHSALEWEAQNATWCPGVGSIEMRHGAPEWET